MPMNLIVREKRKEFGLTQEQVAKYLGVSIPAVSKWENGVSYPDVTLLPALARLLKTDLNTLLCFQEELSQKEISLFMVRLLEVVRQDGFEQGYELAMEKVKEYPTSAELLQSIAMVLQGSLIMMEGSIEEKDKYNAYITALYERVANCEDTKFSNQAKYMLASKYIQEGEYEKGQELLDALPSPDKLDKRSLQARLFMHQGKNQEAGKLLELKLMASVQEEQLILNNLVQIAMEEGAEERAKKLSQCAKNQIEAFQMWEYSKYVVPLQLALLEKNVEDSIFVLEAMLKEMLIPWKAKESFVFSHVGDMETGGNIGQQALPGLLCELENNEQYDFLRLVPAFQQLLEHYRAMCSKEDGE